MLINCAVYSVIHTEGAHLRLRLDDGCCSACLVHLFPTTVQAPFAWICSFATSAFHRIVSSGWAHHSCSIYAFLTKRLSRLRMFLFQMTLFLPVDCRSSDISACGPSVRIRVPVYAISNMSWLRPGQDQDGRQSDVRLLCGKLA